MDGDPFAQFSDDEILVEYLRRLRNQTDRLLAELTRQVSADFLEIPAGEAALRVPSSDNG